MKKALTIYVNDDADITNLCATFISKKADGNLCVSLLNEKVPEKAKGFYMGFYEGTPPITWIYEEDSQK